MAYNPGQNAWIDAFSGYRPPEPDYVGQVSQRVSGLLDLLSPQTWQQLGNFPDPRTVRGSGYEDMQGLAMDWGMNPMMQMGSLLGRIVHHGSPHQWAQEPGFPRGRPRLDKIGTGEGAQAYGHGMYFAESPGVAREYARKLTADANWRASDLVGVDPVTEMYTAIGPKGEKRSFWNQAEALDWAREGKESLYTLDLPDERLPGLLDWDLPLSQQTDAVKSQLMRLIGRDAEDGIPVAWRNTTGGNFVKQQATEYYGSPEAVSEYLGDAGIPGLRYLDAGSRGAGNGTYNYVIWDQSLLDEMARRMQ